MNEEFGLFWLVRLDVDSFLSLVFMALDFYNNRYA
jgi:hypothetical protein